MSPRDEERTGYLPDTFYRVPHLATATMRRKEIAAIYLGSGESIMACGKLWMIRCRHLGAGVYKVFLEEATK